MPEVSSFVDCTELGIQVPSTKEERLRNYTGRKKRYAYKYQAWARFPDGKILGLHGPFVGSTPDINIFRETITSFLLPGERVLADKAYDGSPFTLTPLKLPRRKQNQPRSEFNNLELRFNRLIRARRSHIERVFSRMKRFRILSQTWRHPLEKHPIVVGAVCEVGER
jgi:hypothetical protein